MNYFPVGLTSLSNKFYHEPTKDNARSTVELASIFYLTVEPLWTIKSPDKLPVYYCPAAANN